MNQLSVNAAMGAAPASSSLSHDFSSIKLELTPRLARVALGLLLFWRMWYAALRQLTPDEALYWVWARHLSTGYLDHPPMVAWLIWLSRHVLGDNELGVRIIGVLMSFASA